MADPPNDPWESLWTSVESLASAIRKSRAVNVNSEALRDQAKQVVQEYFRQVRPEMELLRQPEGHIEQIDSLMQRLLELSHGRNSKRSYQRALGVLRKARPNIEFERELLIGRRGSARASVAARLSPGLEDAILKTLGSMVPSAALSYQQAIRDLADQERVSLRGTASELREALREVLDHLAPDADVKKSDGFKLEKDRNRPTMKQKVRFILRSRGLSKTASSSPEAALSRIEEGTGSLARSIYDRGSLSAHVASSRREVQQLKLYIDGLLAEILEVEQ